MKRCFFLSQPRSMGENELSKTSNNQILGSAFDVTRPYLLCQVGDNVIRPCKICGGFQIRDPRSIHP